MSEFFKKNIMIIELEDNNYRYHHILKEFLRVKFLNLDEIVQKSFFLKLSRTFEKSNDINQQIEFLLLGEEYEKAMELILDSNQSSMFFMYKKRIPLEIAILNPDFIYQSFFYHYVNMEFGKCQEIYNKRFCCKKYLKSV